MAQHGDLQVPVIDAHSHEHSEKPAQDAIQQEREHGRSLTDSQASRQHPTSTDRSSLFTPHARWRLVEAKPGAMLRIEPFRRLTREERADTREEAGWLAVFLTPDPDVRVEL